MQKCLQKKSRFKRALGTVIVTAVFFAVGAVAAVYGENTHETTAFGAKYGKYLDISGVNADKVLEDADVQKAEANNEMNNVDVENAKSGVLTDEKQTLEQNAAAEYGEKVNVYFHEKGEYIELPLEEYVVGCVLAEMPSEFEAQALMAQAVAVRSFTCSKMTLDGISSHPDAPVCTDYRHCQSYLSPDEYKKKGDYAMEAVKKISEAVDATRGICAFYDGKPITAVYHASSGVRTKSSSEVWGGDVPYLVSVKAPEDRNVCSMEYTYSYDEAEKLLSRENEAVKCFSVFGREVECENNSDGLVESMNFAGNVIDSNELQRAFSLRSEDFSASLSDDGITFTAYGYGHGVGMSQYGANELAKNGYGFLDILKYYYSGIGFSYIY